jgi:hypothetical protein
MWATKFHTQTKQWVNIFFPYTSLYMNTSVFG